MGTWNSRGVRGEKGENPLQDHSLVQTTDPTQGPHTCMPARDTHESIPDTKTMAIMDYDMLSKRKAHRNAAKNLSQIQI